MSAWTQTVVNGALADSLVTDFGAGFSQNTRLPIDSKLCLAIHYQGVAAVAVRLFLAAAAGATLDNVVLIFDSATATASGNAQNYSGCVDVPIQTGILQPLTFRITKGATNASIWWYATVKMGPGC